MILVRSSLEGAKVGKLSSRAQLECAKIVARFSLYYFGAEKVAQIVSSFPSNLAVWGEYSRLSSSLKGGGAPRRGGTVRIALKGDGGFRESCFPPKNSGANVSEYSRKSINGNQRGFTSCPTNAVSFL